MRNSLIAISGFLVSLLAALPSLGGEQTPLAPDRLAGIITGAPDHRATFREERRLLLLTEPVKLEGTVRFRTPDRFEKHTLSPHREDLVVEGEWVSVSLPDRDTVLRLNMADDPVLHGLLFSLQSLLTGQPGRLSEIFAVESWGGADGWTLRLKPVAAKLADRLQVVRVTGERHWIRTIELWETTGDYLIISIDSEVIE